MTRPRWISWLGTPVQIPMWIVVIFVIDAVNDTATWIAGWF